MEKLSWIATVVATAISIVTYLFPSPLNLQVLVFSEPTNDSIFLTVALQGMIFFFFAALALGSLAGGLADSGLGEGGCAALIGSLIAGIGCLVCLWLFIRIAWKVSTLLL